MTKRIRARERDTILQSLRAGVVPNIGLQYIQVGRSSEVEALLNDIERVKNDGAFIRFIIGEYGSGKTFFLHLIRTISHQKGLVTVHADLSPDRRLQASGGQARSLYSELIKNMSTKTSPNGGAIKNVVEKFIGKLLSESSDDNTVDGLIHSALTPIRDMVGGYDFVEVIKCYWEGHDTGNEELKSDAIRWLRAEYTTKTDAKNALGVRTIINDDNFYDQIKLLARFVKVAGYQGLIVGIDEMVNLYKLHSTIARKNNYEQILRILNDCLQGNVEGFGFLMNGTPEFLMDSRKGLYSYDALQTRLSQNSFAEKEGLKDFSGPIIKLDNLQPEDIYVLLVNIRNVFASYDEDKYLISDEGIKSFMHHCQNNIGASYFQTPRNTIKEFVHLLSTLEQNEDVSWEMLINKIDIKEDVESVLEDDEESEADDDLSSFSI